MIETLERPRKEVSSDAFRIEYSPDVPENVLIDDVVSYLGEYRFSLQKYSYSFIFKDGKLIDPHRQEPMEDLAQRAIVRKISEGRSSLREKAEKQGFINLDSQLRLAREGDTVVWASPPVTREEGYGAYGFIFIGNVNKGNASGRTIQMTAIRVENPKIEQFNKALHLLTGEKVNYGEASEFVANPRVVNEHLEEGYIDAILGISFSFKPNKEEWKKFIQIIQRINPLIKDFIHLSNKERRRALNTIENYTLKLIKDYEDYQEENTSYAKNLEINLRIKDIVWEFGHKPPVAAGSCGSTSSKNVFSSSNVFSKYSSLSSLLSSEEQEWFHCPECDYQADGPVGDACPKCHLTKDEYAKKSGVKVCD